MRIYIESNDNFAVYKETWQPTVEVEAPVSGSVIDVEARSAIDSILTALEAQGILNSTT